MLLHIARRIARRALGAIVPAGTLFAGQFHELHRGYQVVIRKV